VNKYSAKVLKRSITFVLRVWPNSPQKINKMQSICYCPDWTGETGLQLIAREECRQGTDGFQMVSPLLHVGLLRQGGKGKVAPRENRGGAGKKKGTEGAGHSGCLYRRNLNIQRPRFNYSHVIHPTSESSMWISKRPRFDEIFASAVSDQPSEQWFKKTNFWSTPEPLSVFFWRYSRRIQKTTPQKKFQMFGRPKLLM
jgi:hypothetical protein